MTTGRSIFGFDRRARGSRLLSYALLFLFVYSSTAEAVHHHGARNLSAATTSAVSDAGAVSNSSTPSGPQKSGPASECLVCQFQQNLSSAEIFTPLLVLAPATSNQTFPTTVALVRSVTNSTPQGRGPPAIS